MFDILESLVQQSLLGLDPFFTVPFYRFTPHSVCAIVCLAFSDPVQIRPVLPPYKPKPLYFFISSRSSLVLRPALDPCRLEV